MNARKDTPAPWLMQHAASSRVLHENVENDALASFRGHPGRTRIPTAEALSNAGLTAEDRKVARRKSIAARKGMLKSKMELQKSKRRGGILKNKMRGGILKNKTTGNKRPLKGVLKNKMSSPPWTASKRPMKGILKKKIIKSTTKRRGKCLPKAKVPTWSLSTESGMLKEGSAGRRRNRGGTLKSALKSDPRYSKHSLDVKGIKPVALF